MFIDQKTAIKLLKEGSVVALPTETVYGLAASINCPAAVEEIFRLKGRPKQNPLIVHLADKSQLANFCKDIPADALKLVQKFWPGPLSIVLEVEPQKLSPTIRANLKTAAFRVPSHPLTLDIIANTGPLVMPSANISGRPSTTTAQHILNDFNTAVSVVDGGKCVSGLESTIIYFNQNRWVILRLGYITQQDLASCLGYQPEVYNLKKEQTQVPLAPGQMFKHYSPKAKLITCYDQTFTHKPQTPILGFSDRNYPAGYELISLGNLSNPNEVAANLYSALRQLDELKLELVLVDMDFPENDLWACIRERLLRASFCQIA